MIQINSQFSALMKTNAFGMTCHSNSNSEIILKQGILATWVEQNLPRLYCATMHKKAATIDGNPNPQ
jgi:hypothetical protein